MNNVSVTLNNFKVGDLVVRGKDWKWGKQDDSDYGVIIRLKDNGWLRVQWRNGYEGSYRIGEDYFDLYFYTKHLTPSLINRIGHLL